MPFLDDPVDVTRQVCQFVGIAPSADEVRVIAPRRVLDVAHPNRDRDASAYASHKRVLLRKTRQLVEQRTGAQRGRIPEQALVRLMSEPVGDDGAALGHHRLAELARALAREQQRQAELPSLLGNAFEYGSRATCATARVLLARTSEPPCFSVIPMPASSPGLVSGSESPGAYVVAVSPGPYAAASSGLCCRAGQMAYVMEIGHP